ncbi:uncharacterized protein BJX67DRAFT_380417 [Aspergillus lucknowensis]|uniref:Subtelomeric hrmA-associated cluster protein AFUB-079030/YDR124W-like helical bundle domain-containing protein n=1 Tax=Aspergillus lucknowensis TaxID=176173 RepID=A0ABR4LUK7_9EURO
MVVNASVSKLGSAKRPLASLQDDCHGWDPALPMSAPLHPSVNLPFAHYALIYLDNMGKLKVSESPSIQEQNRTVFTPEVREKFLEILGSKIGYHKPLLRRASAAPYAYNHTHEMSYHRQGKRRKASAHDSALEITFSERFPEPTPQVVSTPTNNMVALEIGDTDKVQDYYETALKHFQQINCRLIAKAFIKFIEPRKQVKHPYNGGRPRAGAPPGEKGDPERTKPEWWPAGVQHKEPDHLKKEQRLRLLIHILRKLGKFNITAEKLEEVARDSKRQLRPEESIEEKMEILNEIFKVRKLEERFERGEVDADTVVFIRNRDAPAKDVKDNESVVSDTEQKFEIEEIEDAEEVPSVSSSEHLSASFASVDPLPLSRSFSMGNDRGQTLPMNESFSFEETLNQERSYFPSTGGYTNEYSSHPILEAPTTSGVVSPHEHPGGFDYLSHAPMAASVASEHQRPLSMPMQHLGPYDTWNSPFRHNAYNSMEYAATQTLTQNPMHYPMSLCQPHPHDLPRGPDLGRERPSHMELMGSRTSISRSF